MACRPRFNAAIGSGVPGHAVLGSSGLFPAMVQPQGGGRTRGARTASSTEKKKTATRSIQAHAPCRWRVSKLERGIPTGL
jgi:hypothetical protein